MNSPVRNRKDGGRVIEKAKRRSVKCSTSNTFSSVGALDMKQAFDTNVGTDEDGWRRSLEGVRAIFKKLYREHSFYIKNEHL